MSYQNFIIALMCLAASGCTAQTAHVPMTKKHLMSDFLLQVQKSDGINKEEAVLIAQSQLIFRGDEKSYYIAKPQLESDGIYWLVHFYPVNKTFAEASLHHELIVMIDKDTGLARTVK